jgi:hypothetical protein
LTLLRCNIKRYQSLPTDPIIKHKKQQQNENNFNFNFRLYPVHVVRKSRT